MRREDRCEDDDVAIWNGQAWDAAVDACLAQSERRSLSQSSLSSADTAAAHPSAFFADQLTSFSLAVQR